LDKYEKKKQELEKLEALLERLALRKKLTRMQRDHSWCQALLDFLASYAISY
jgi:mRNA-degrading endonuclease YafQ of YafQ-DinJ toxin-antitoxin module